MSTEKSLVFRTVEVDPDSCADRRVPELRLIFCFTPKM